jgi:uncharacterized protein YceH (UPF0502 family)
MDSSLSAAEQRVLGCLIEKDMTTPDYYPMTVNGLTAACNQKTNREPVVDYSETDVVEALDQLRERGMARTVHGKGDRALKYKHVAGELLGIEGGQLALLAVLLLRGPQTAGELRTRTGRYVEFTDLGQVVDELSVMGSAEEPLVVLQERRPGEKEPRYEHLLGDSPVDPPVDQPSTQPTPDADRVAELEAELTELRDRVTRMERELGLD